jgi:hypothetical protein
MSHCIGHFMCETRKGFNHADHVLFHYSDIFDHFVGQRAARTCIFSRILTGLSVWVLRVLPDASVRDDFQG